MKHSTTVLSFISILFYFSSNAFANPTKSFLAQNENSSGASNFNSDDRPTYNPNSEKFSGSASPLMHVAPKSLAAQKLSKSSYPGEAELYCGTGQCIFGLTRGLVVGGDLAGMLYAPLRKYFDPNWVSGTLSIADVFGGFQILDDVDSKNYMNAQIGYRRISFDDGTNEIVTQGMTTEVNYSQLITPMYMQNLEFSAFLVFGNSSLNNPQALNINSAQHGKLANSASYFYRISQSYPTYRVALPADLEVMNWSAAQTGLEMPIRAYFQFSPFFIQNNLSFSENNISLRKTEQNFGVRISGIGSYESSGEKSKSGRYALKIQLGMDISSSRFSTANSGGADLNLPRRSSVAPFVELAGSWQF